MLNVKHLLFSACYLCCHPNCMYMKQTAEKRLLVYVCLLFVYSKSTIFHCHDLNKYFIFYAYLQCTTCTKKDKILNSLLYVIMILRKKKNTLWWLATKLFILIFLFKSFFKFSSSVIRFFFFHISCENWDISLPAFFCVYVFRYKLFM